LRQLTQAKKTEERIWLNEVSNCALRQSVRQLAQAFQNFFNSCKGQGNGTPSALPQQAGASAGPKGRKVKPPRFKKKTNQQSATFTKTGFSLLGEQVYLAKIGIVKPIWSRPLPSAPSSVTVIKDSANRYFLSFVVNVEPEQVPAQEPSVGIDLGINTFAMLSTGEAIKSPDYSHLFHRIAQLQKGLARRKKGSCRWHKRRLAIARTYNQIADLRLDFLHKLSTKLAQVFGVIVLENLNVSGMLKNRRLARAIAQQGWSIFRQLLEFKAGKYLRELRVIDRWEPTSQVCSSCGYKWGKLDLSVRKVKCLSCGTSHDRDINAAQNIRAVGMGHRPIKRTWSGRKTYFGSRLR